MYFSYVLWNLTEPFILAEMQIEMSDVVCQRFSQAMNLEHVLNKQMSNLQMSNRCLLSYNYSYRVDLWHVMRQRCLIYKFISCICMLCVFQV